MSDTYKLRQPAEPAAAAAENSATAEQEQAPANPPGRLVSLDAYRGFIMSMLAASGFGIAALAGLDPESSVWQVWDYDSFQRLRFHFTHPDWQSVTGWMGVSFWDLIQPSFMFMVGVAMPFSYARRGAMGSSPRWQTVHAFIRAMILVLMGVFLYSLSQQQTNWIFTNVLAQIGLGYFFAYLLLGRTAGVQVAAIAAVLVGYWGLFVMNPPPQDYDYASVNASAERGEVYEGRFAPWSKNANVAHFFDVWLLNSLRMPVDADTEAPQSPAKPGLVRQWWFASPERFTHNNGGYVTLNFVPSLATTLLGVLCGQLLMTSRPPRRKLLLLLSWGAVCLGLGLLAHHSVCPIVKRIWTPSWVLFSGGYVIWMLAAFYLVFDILPFRRLAFPLVVVGMNSIVMYMMGQMLRPWVTEKVVRVHFGAMLQTLIGPDAVNREGMGAMVLPTAAFVIFWLIALWLYRNRYFVRV